MCPEQSASDGAKPDGFTLSYEADVLRALQRVVIMLIANCRGRELKIRRSRVWIVEWYPDRREVRKALLSNLPFLE